MNHVKAPYQSPSPGESQIADIPDLVARYGAPTQSSPQTSPGSDSEPVPAVSVCMPVYNVELYVREAIDSILRQTLTDFELVVVDDGSTDGTLAVVEGLAKQD